MSVSRALFRQYRPIILWICGILLAVEVIGVIAITSVTDLRFSFWVAMAGSMSRYWTLVVGIMLVSMNLRQFVVNGVTRREFVAGAAVFMLILAIGWAAAVVLGHWLEGIVVDAFGERGASYPVLSAGQLLGDFGHVLPQTLAWPLSGAIIAIGFYRFRVWLGLVVMLLGAVPAMVADGLLAIDEQGHVRQLLPYLPALLISLAVTALGAVAFRGLSRDVAIRRTAG